MRINTLYFAVFLSLAVWMWGWVTLSTTRGHKLAIRTVAIIIAVSSGWLLLTGTGGKAVDWLEYDSAAIAKDVEEGRPVLIKFTADWCTTCTVIDKFVYSKKDVVKPKYDFFPPGANVIFSPIDKIVGEENKVYLEGGWEIRKLFKPHERVESHRLILSEKGQEVRLMVARRKVAKKVAKKKVAKKRVAKKVAKKKVAKKKVARKKR